MKRNVIKKSVVAAESFWSTAVTTINEIKAEIQKAIDAGTTFEDVDDYLNELVGLDIINEEEFSELLNWAAPYVSNSRLYVGSSRSVVRRQSGSISCTNETSGPINVEEIFDELAEYFSGVELKYYDDDVIVWTEEGLKCSIRDYMSMTEHDLREELYYITEAAQIEHEQMIADVSDTM